MMDEKIALKSEISQLHSHFASKVPLLLKFNKSNTDMNAEIEDL